MVSTTASSIVALAAAAAFLASKGADGAAPLIAGCRPNYPENLCWESSPLRTRFGAFEYIYSDCNIKSSNRIGTPIGESDRTRTATMTMSVLGRG